MDPDFSTAKLEFARISSELKRRFEKTGIPPDAETLRQRARRRFGVTNHVLETKMRHFSRISSTPLFDIADFV